MIKNYSELYWLSCCYF